MSEDRDGAKRIAITGKTNEQVKFRLFQMPCCNFLCCWVNPRFPTYCPECGAAVYLRLKSGEFTRVCDETAWLGYNRP